MTKFVKASDLGAKAVELVENVERTGEGLVLTSEDGTPIADIVPHQAPKAKNARGVWKGKVIIKGDIISPIDVEWDAMK